MDFCEVAEKVPESLVPPQTVTIGVSIPGPSALGVNQSGAMPLQYCHLASGFLTQFRGLGTYLVPKVDVEVSTTFRSNPGVQLAANYNVRRPSWRSRSAARHQAASRTSPST